MILASSFLTNVGISSDLFDRFGCRLVDDWGSVTRGRRGGIGVWRGKVDGGSSLAGA